MAFLCSLFKLIWVWKWIPKLLTLWEALFQSKWSSKVYSCQKSSVMESIVLSWYMEDWPFFEEMNENWCLEICRGEALSINGTSNNAWISALNPEDLLLNHKRKMEQSWPDKKQKGKREPSPHTVEEINYRFLHCGFMSQWVVLLHSL